MVDPERGHIKGLHVSKNCKQITLIEQLSKYSNRAVTKCITVKLCQSSKYLHAHGIVYRTASTCNIVVTWARGLCLICMPEGRGHTYQAKPECPILQLICNICQGLIACIGRSITQANTSAATGCIIYTYLKFSIMGQQLVYVSGYVWF